LGKPYGIKPKCYWEHLGEYIWEHDENTLGTREKEKKSLPPHAPPDPQKEKTRPFTCVMLNFPLVR